MGCRTEPAAVHIAHVLQRLHFFQFFNFFCILHDLPHKKNTCPYRQKKFNFFYNSHELPQKKIIRIYRKNKRWRRPGPLTRDKTRRQLVLFTSMSHARSS